MKKTVYVIIAFLCPVLLMGQENVKKQVSDFIDSWHASAANNDQESYFNAIDENGIYIGTDSTEVWTKEEFYDWSTPYFQEQKGWSFEKTSRNIYFSDDWNMAWFDELLDFGKGTLRGSGVLVKRGDDWKIIHYVLSVPVPNEKYQEVIRVIETKPVMKDDRKE